ncbi:MAG: SPASM domain-containing protein [Nanoarchaeota archaeon]
MSFDTFKTCIDKIPPRVNIGFSGMCEPWLNPECTKMLIYAHERGHKLEVFTTLVDMKIADIDLISDIPFLEFCVHLPSDGKYENIVVDKYYLETLDKMCKSSIKASYLFNGKKLNAEVNVLMKGNSKNVAQNHLISRANNIIIEQERSPKRRKGIIGCRRGLHYNVLLPNGEVILCCMDYGMKHVLGNLLLSDYDALFKSKKFKNIKRGLWNQQQNILCRYCDEIAYDLINKLYQDAMLNFKKIKLLIRRLI